MIFGRETAPDAASSGAVDAPNSAQTPPAGLPGGTMIFGRPGAAPRATQAYGPAASAPGDDAARATQRLPSFPPSEPAREVPPNQLPQYDDSIADEDGADASVPFDARATVLDPMPAYPRRSPADPGVSNPLSSAADPAPGAKPQSPDGAAPAWIPPAARRTTGTMPVPARPLEPFTPPTLGAPNPDASLLIDDGTTALINARNRRRNFVLGVFAILVIGTAGYFGYDRWSKRERPPPPEVVAAAQEGVTALRRDDPKSLEAASAAEQALVASHPRYVDARVQLLTALLFQYDDLRMQLQHAKQRSGTLTTQIAQLKERRSPGDWQNRVNAMVDELREIKKQTDPLVDRAADLERRINDELRSIQQLVPDEAAPQRRVQRVRAEALYFGIKGADEAIALSERYRLLGGKEGWGDVAFAEYALNAHVAPQTRRQAREALEALKAKDNSWVRLYVLIGRLALADKDFDIANTAFESALTLNPEHEPARRMLRQLEQERADQ
ncbi:MAG: hypothetical protein IRZ16_23520 [Myxococcaceae bacterium]|nr:hypothetical protein [Myxococcaceae bacterium]